MERRVFVAILLSFAVLYGYQALFVPPQKPAIDVVEKKEPTPPATDSVAEAPVSAESPSQLPSPTRRSPRHPSARSSSIPRRREVVLTNRGGRILHWRLEGLSRQRRRHGRSRAVRRSSRSTQAIFADRRGRGVDPSSEQRALPRDRRCRRPCGRIEASRRRCHSSFRTHRGLHVRKEFRFDPKNYVVAFSASVMSGDRALNPTIAWGPGLGDAGATAGGGSFFTGNYVQPPQAIYHTDGERRAHQGDERRSSNQRTKAASGSRASTITTSWPPS